VIERILAFLSSNQPGFWAGPLLSLIAFTETVFPPFPGDILFVLLSGWAMTGGLSFAAGASFGLGGCLIASCLLFYIGHSPGRRFVDGWLSKKVDPDKVEKAKGLVRNYGPVILTGSRFLPGIRSLIVLIAGTSGMRFSLAFLPITLSAAAWYAILSLAGRLFGKNIDSATVFVRQFEVWIWVLIGVAIITVLVFRRFRRSGEDT